MTMSEVRDDAKPQFALPRARASPRGMRNPSRMHPALVTKSVLPAGILLFTMAR